MTYYRKRIQNRILQALYRPRVIHNSFLPKEALAFFDEIDNKIEEAITPLLDELF